MQKLPKSRANGAHDDLIETLQTWSLDTRNALNQYYSNLMVTYVARNNDAIWRRYTKQFNGIPDAEQLAKEELKRYELLHIHEIKTIHSVIVSSLRRLQHKWDIEQPFLKRYTDESMCA